MSSTCWLVTLLLFLVLVISRRGPLIEIHYQQTTQTVPIPPPPLSPPIPPPPPQARLPPWSCPSMGVSIKDKLRQASGSSFLCPYCRQSFDTRMAAQQHCRTGHVDRVKMEGDARMCQIDDADMTVWQEFYKVRAKQCELGTDSLPAAGTPWGSYKLHHFTELMHNVARELHLQNESTVFEAGFGCGQLLSRLISSHNVLVSGIDLTPEVVGVAMHNLAQLLSVAYPKLVITSLTRPQAVVLGSESERHRLCRGDVRDLSYVPSDSYDHAFTFGVLFYLPTVEAVCQAAQELVRIVKPGGSIWFGCHQNFPDYDLPPLDEAFWTNCIHGTFPLARVRFLRMRELLNSDLYDPDRRYSVFVDK